MIRLFLFGFGIMFLSSSFVPKKNCSGDDEYEKGIASLKDYTLLKDYRVSLSKGKKGEKAPIQSYPISLNNGMKYKFFCIGNPSNETKMVVSIFAKPNGEIMMATSFNTTLKKHYETVEFTSKTTGNYYISFHFEEGKEGCGVGFVCVAK